MNQKRHDRAVVIILALSLAGILLSISSSVARTSAQLPGATKGAGDIYLPTIMRDYCRDASGDFFDDFSTPASGWYVGDDAYVRSEYLSGEYRVLSKDPDYFYLYSAPTCPRQDYSVEVDARWIGAPGSSYGLMFGMQEDFDRFYLVELNTDFQMYGIWRLDSTGWTTIAPVAGSSSINSGTASNHLKITRSGNQIALVVNSSHLGSWYDSGINGLTEVGLISDPYNDQSLSDARFDNFKVTRLGSSSSVSIQQAQNLLAPAVPGHRSEQEAHGLFGGPTWDDVRGK